MWKKSHFFFFTPNPIQKTHKKKRNKKRDEKERKGKRRDIQEEKMEVQPFSGTSFVNYRNVEYILLAEFDIVTGSTVKHQFPYEIGVDDQ